MNNRVVTMTMLVIASLLASPVVVADDTQDIPTNAQNTGAHDSLVAALSHAGLVSALQADGPFTVFAPTDDAFAAQESISPHSTPTRRTQPSATYCCITS